MVLESGFVRFFCNIFTHFVNRVQKKSKFAPLNETIYSRLLFY